MLIKKKNKNVGNFCNFQKMPKVNNRPLSENSPNLVTLVPSSIEDDAEQRKSISLSITQSFKSSDTDLSLVKLSADQIDLRRSLNGVA
jgi:hypothetical protein